MVLICPKCTIDMKSLVLLLLMVPALAYAGSQTATTDGGILQVMVSYDSIKAGEDPAIRLEFINPTTGKVQDHVDYTLHMYMPNQTVFGPTALIHSSNGIIPKLSPPIPQDGSYTLDVTVSGILFNPITPQIATLTISTDEEVPAGGGCLVATATFGSEMAPQVQYLREIRDQKVLNTDAGSAFMEWFYHVYYTVSPGIADMLRESQEARGAMSAALAPMLATLHIMELANSEVEVVMYGMMIIALNVFIYLMLPVGGVIAMRQAIKSRPDTTNRVRIS